MKHKMRIALSSLALMYFTAACGGPSTPVAVPEPTSRPPEAAASPAGTSTTSQRREKTLEETITAPTNTPEINIDIGVTSTPEPFPPISFDLTAKLRHPYQEPSNAAEEYAHKIFVEENNDYVGYMKAVRSINNSLWYSSAFGVVKNPLNGFEWASLLNTTIKQMELEPYPALDTMLEFLMKDPKNQTFVEIGIEHVQETPIGDVEIDGSPDADKEEFKKFMSGFFAQQEQPKEEAAAYTLEIPDGSKVVFSGLDLGEKGIFLVNISTEEVFYLTNDKDFNQPDLSPDGKLIAFSSYKNDESGVWLMDIETRRIAKLTGGNKIGSYPSWSNDGKNIVFRQSGSVYSIDLYQSDCKFNLVEEIHLDGIQRFSPESSQVLYQTGQINLATKSLDETKSIWIVNSDGSNQHQFKEGIKLSEDPELRRAYFGFDWSSNGKIAALMVDYNIKSNKSNKYSEFSIMYSGIVTMDSDGSNIRKIAWTDAALSSYKGQVQYLDPRWSHDEKFLFYQQQRISLQHKMGLFVTDTETENTLDIRTFKWTTVETPLTKVGLDKLLGIEGKQPYNTECPRPQTGK